MKVLFAVGMTLFFTAASAKLPIPAGGPFYEEQGNNTFSFKENGQWSSFNGDNGKLQFAECSKKECLAIYKSGIANIRVVSWCINNPNYIAFSSPNDSSMYCLANTHRILTANNCNACEGLISAFGPPKHPHN